MTTDVTPIFETYFSSNRGPVPSNGKARQPCNYGIQAAMNGHVIHLALVFRSGSAYCCCQYGCHLGLRDGERWIGLRRALLARGLKLPTKLELQLYMIVEEGALFFAGLNEPTAYPRCRYHFVFKELEFAEEPCLVPDRWEMLDIEKFNP